MDAWGIVIFVVSMILYLVSHKNRFFLFAGGIGAGIVIGAIWAMMIVGHVFSGY